MKNITQIPHLVTKVYMILILIHCNADMMTTLVTSLCSSFICALIVGTILAVKYISLNRTAVVSFSINYTITFAF